jgi:CcmD family protein
MSWLRLTRERDRHRFFACGAAAVVIAATLAAGGGLPAAAQDDAQADAPAAPDEALAEQVEESQVEPRPTPSYHQLVPVEVARSATVEVLVAGMVDRPSVRQVEVAGGSGYAFTLTDATGGALEVVGRGKLPVGFGVARTVVVAGSGQGDRFLATEVLVPGANRGLIAVMAVTLVGWLGLFAYVFRLSRRLRRLEEA